MTIMRRRTEYIADGNREYMQRYREHVNTLISRSSYLDDMDKTLIRLYLVDGYSISEIALVAGISPCRVSRRLKRLLKRIRSSEYISYLRIHLRLRGIERRIGRDYFLRGISMQRISLETGCSLYRVRQIITGIRIKSRRQRFCSSQPPAPAFKRGAE